MSNDGDEHYQPWLRNQGNDTPRPGGVSRPAPLPTESKTGQPDRPPTGPRTSAGALSADELLARPIALPPADPPGPGIGEKVADALSSAAQVAAGITRKAEIPRRSRKVADSGAQLAAKGLKKSGEALKAVAAAASDAANRAGEAAGPRIRAAAIASRKTLDKGARQAQVGLSSGVKRAGEAARKLANAAPAVPALPGMPAMPKLTRDDAALPESQLDKLLEEETIAAAQPEPAPRPASGLPLFGADTPTAQPAERAAQAESTPQPARDPASTAAPPPPPRAEPHRIAPPPTEPPRSTTPPPPGATAGRTGDGWRRHPATWAAAAALVTGLAFVAGAKWGGSAMDRATTETIVRDYLLDHPEILPQAMERLNEKRTASAVDRLRARIEKPFSGAWAGAADGNVTLTVFTDYACTFCRASVPDIERLLREDPKLKIVFRELPVIGAESEPAARLALVAARHGLYMPMHRMLFASGNPDSSARASAAARFSLAAPPAELNDPAITVELRSNLEIARELGFDGTPAWVVGDSAMSGAVGYERLKAAVAKARGS